MPVNTRGLAALLGIGFVLLATACSGSDGDTGGGAGGSSAVTTKPYDAFRTGDGPFCGSDADGRDVFCKARDTCTDADAIRCGRSADGSYQAFRTAGGPLRGTDADGRDVFCEPGGSCSSAATNRCEPCLSAAEVRTPGRTKRKKPGFPGLLGLFPWAPAAGLEPATRRLTVACSTN